MDFLLTRGRDFQEHFDFKNNRGKPISAPAGSYKLTVTRGDFAREYTPGRGLSRQRTGIIWKIPAKETQDFEYRTLYYTLYVDDQELVRGVLKVQEV